MLFTEVYNIEDIKKILKLMASDHGLKNVPNIVVTDEIKSYGLFVRSTNTIYLNSVRLTLKRFFYTLSHELYHANDYNYDGTNKRELRAELFGLQYLK